MTLSANLAPRLGLVESALATLRLHGASEKDVRWVGDRYHWLDWSAFAVEAADVDSETFCAAQDCAPLTIVGAHFLLYYDPTSRQHRAHRWWYFRLEPPRRRGQPDVLMLARGAPTLTIDTLPVDAD